MSRRKNSRPTKKQNSSKRQREKLPASNLTNAEQLGKLQRWLLPNDRIFAKLKLHGNTTWIPESLVWLALCWAWSESSNLTDAFRQATTCCQVITNGSALSTYQGFMGALVRWTDPLMSVLWPVLHQRMQQMGGRFWHTGGWIPIAFDGSRSTAPRSKANEKAFCAARSKRAAAKALKNKKRKKNANVKSRAKNKDNQPHAQEPQVWITMLWHMGLRLPWMWRLGPSNSSERGHVMEMLNEGDFPENTLFCGDAGFVGYALWASLMGRGMHFLVRVGANVSLLTEMADYRIQKNRIVLCWPRTAQQLNLPPLRLRLVKVKVGKTDMWMLTNVMQQTNLTNAQIVTLYKLRWGIEIEFRGLKQTLNRAKLRCRNNHRLLAELNWSLMAMTVAELFGLKEQLASPPPQRNSDDRDVSRPDPRRLSLANTIRALRSCLTHLQDVPPRGEDLPRCLRLALTDGYRRQLPKRARYRPPNPHKKPLGDPQMRKVSHQEKKILNGLNQSKHTT